MKPFSEDLLAKLNNATVAPPETRPRVLLGAEEVAEVRRRASATPGFVDRLVKEARAASENEDLFGAAPELPYFCQTPLRSLANAAFITEDEVFAARALEGVEVMFSFPPEEWVARPHRPMRCDHAMLNVASAIGSTMDLCSELWPADAVASISERINAYTVARFLETWRNQDAHWSSPDYHWNWKIMCCGEMGTAAIACAEAISDFDAVLRAALEGCLDILDFVPPEGDWAEGPGYWLGTLGHGVKFGVGLRRATGGAVNLFEHPALRETGDYIVHVTEPDGQVYNFNDNGISLGSSLDYLLLLANLNRRGDWARTARASDHTTVERLIWDDPSLADAIPNETSRSYPTTGVVTMRSGWDDQATFVGLKSGSSAVGHSQLDANSFVVTSRGERLLIDEGIWPYGHALGFFDSDGGERWNFDGNGTIGHNTVMVDGEGQRYGADYPGRIVSFERGEEVDVAVGDATAAYGRKLKQYLRTLAFLKPDVVLVYDRISSEEPRLLEWLFHHRAEVYGDERLTGFRRNGVTLSLSRVIPEHMECWRMSDVKRTSMYTESNQYRPHRVSVEYRSFGPFHPCREIEVLWAIHVGDASDRPEVEASVGDRTATVRVVSGCGNERSVTLRK